MIGEKTHKRGRNVRKSFFKKALNRISKNRGVIREKNCRTCIHAKTNNTICDECRVTENLTFTKWTAKK